MKFFIQDVRTQVIMRSIAIVLFAVTGSFLIPTASSQIDGFMLPYNPDAQPDGYIGSADVVALLTYYGQSFSPDGVYASEDSTHMAMDVGSMSYIECLASCNQLAGSWRIAGLLDFGFLVNSLDAGSYHLNRDDYVISAGYVSPKWTKGSGSAWYVSANSTTGNHYAESTCMCATQERPKVEYCMCTGTNTDLFESCTSEKSADGWYPLPNSPWDNGSQVLNSFSQAFWRWAQ